MAANDVITPEGLALVVQRLDRIEAALAIRVERQTAREPIETLPLRPQ